MPNNLHCKLHVWNFRYSHRQRGFWVPILRLRRRVQRNLFQITLSSDQSVWATFAKSSSNSAQLTVVVSGQGTVTSSPAGINCPSTCTATFNNGTAITLTATPASGYTFSGFSGDCSGSTCQVTVSNNQNASVNAAFAQVAHDITAVKHIIIVTQENRSFDHYFGHLSDYWQSHSYPQATDGTTFDGEPATSSDADLMEP